MAWHKGQLYMVGFGNNSLYTLDFITGEAALAATGTRITGSDGAPRILNGVASHEGELYVTSVFTGSLYRVDLNTFTGTRIGADAFGAVSENYPYAIASHGSPGSAELYMVGGETDALYTIDADTGTATRVGTATDFGTADETSPIGLASHGGSLYMTGTANNRLYTLDTTTGATAGTATRVGTATDFGVGESSGHGIATGYTLPTDFTLDPTTGTVAYTGSAAAAGTGYALYARVSDGRDASDKTSSAIDDSAVVRVRVTNRAPSFSEDGYSYSLPVRSTATVAVGAPSATDPEDQTLTYSLRPSDPPERMYMLGDGADALYTLDSGTSEAARVNAAVVQFGVSERSPRSMAWHNGRLYMTGNGTDSLYTVDTATGDAVLVATGAQITGSGGPSRHLAGVASHEGELYVTTTGTGRLYRVDLKTLTGTRIGDDDFGPADETHPYDIASHGSPDSAESAELYMIGGRTDRLYTLDTTTGTAVPVGTATNFGTADETSPSGLASHGGSLYMTGTANNRLYTLDTTTGATAGTATRVGTATDFDTGESSGHGIATGYTLPAGFTINAATGEINYTGDPAPEGTTYVLYIQISDGKADDNTDSNAIDAVVPVTVTVPVSGPPRTALPPSTSETGTQTSQTGTQTSEPGTQDYFIDDNIPPSVHEPNINYIAAAGITQGCNPQGTRYCPHDPVTRAQTASFLARALNLKPPADPRSGTFLDTAGNHHLDNIRAITAAGIILECSPTGRNFCPDRSVTRAEMAYFLAKAFSLEILRPRIPNPVPRHNRQPTPRQHPRHRSRGDHPRLRHHRTLFLPRPRHHPRRDGHLPGPGPPPLTGSSCLWKYSV